MMLPRSDRLALYPSRLLGVGRIGKQNCRVARAPPPDNLRDGFGEHRVQNLHYRLAIERAGKLKNSGPSRPSALPIARLRFLRARCDEFFATWLAASQ
jgi:hypothetical protein